MTQKEAKDNGQNLGVLLSCDPKLLSYFEKVAQPPYQIRNFEEELKSVQTLASSEKGVLLSRVTQESDYQQQIFLTALLQENMDRLQEIGFSIYHTHYKWSEVYRVALRHLNTTYFRELNDLRDGVRKSVISAALHPIEEGVERLEYLIKQLEKIKDHHKTTSWHIKEATTIIKEYLMMSKFQNSNSRT